MELKKTKRTDLENKRTLFFQIGMVITLGIVFMAFMGTKPVEPVNVFDRVETGTEDDFLYTLPIIPETPKPLPPIPKVIEMIKLIPDDGVIENPFDFIFDEPNDFVLVDVPIIKPESTENDDIDSTFSVVEDMPEFPGGQNSLLHWIAKNTNYPKEALTNNIEGKVYVSFVVNKTGGISNAKVIREVDPYLDKEALRVVNSLPKWKPGMQRKKPVNVSFTVPINFKLEQ